jgi:hypothetical protein
MSVLQAASVQVTNVAPEAAATPSPFEALHDRMQQLWRQLHFQGRTAAKQGGKSLAAAGEGEKRSLDPSCG